MRSTIGFGPKLTEDAGLNVPFEPLVRADGTHVNYGAFVTAGVGMGGFARIQTGPTDYTALTAPLLCSERIE